MAPVLSLTPITVSSANIFRSHHLQPPRGGVHCALLRPSCHRISAVTSASEIKKQPPVNGTALAHHQAKVIKSLEGWASDHMLPFLNPVEQSWQPQDFLPDFSNPTEEFTEEVRSLRQRTAELSDDYFVVLAGNMITEEALPTYQSAFSTAYGFQPESGADPGPWATWTRCWSAEENRHGDLLHTFLYLSGRVDMVMIQRTIQYLIGSGMDQRDRPGIQKEPYSVAIYTSFQERATAISHGNTARLAKQQGDTVLSRICGTIAADEKRHEKAYVALVGKLLEVDPDGAMLAIGEALGKTITMPAHLMYDGQDPDLFHHFSAAAQRIGVYTASDYVNILEHLVAEWRLERVEGLTAAGREAQEFVCELGPKFRRLQERAEKRAKKTKPYAAKFSWIFSKELSL